MRSLGLLEEEHTLMLEDLGNAPDLATWLGRSASAATHEAAAKILGTFFGRLHAVTAGGRKYADKFTNPSLQERRFSEYYNMVGPALREADFPGWDQVDDRAQRLGLRLLDTGVCLTHGDLRAKDLHLVPTGLRLTDWECCYYGLPAQDVAQLSAHLWMHAHCARDMATKKRLRTVQFYVRWDVSGDRPNASSTLIYRCGVL